jgi:hypothetical protein
VSPSDPLTGDLTAADALRLLTKLEHAPALIVSHWQTLEGLIAACMDATFAATETGDKVQLAAIEYRARLLRERAKTGQN